MGASTNYETLKAFVKQVNHGVGLIKHRTGCNMHFELEEDLARMGYRLIFTIYNNGETYHYIQEVDRDQLLNPDIHGRLATTVVKYCLEEFLERGLIQRKKDDAIPWFARDRLDPSVRYDWIADSDK